MNKMLVLSREKDLALALASPNLRFQAPVPGTSLVGIEVPNNNPSESKEVVNDFKDSQRISKKYSISLK